MALSLCLRLKQKRMNILIIGSGGREHTLAWKICQSPLVKKLFLAPGNAGTAQLGTNVDLSPDDFSGLGTFALQHQIDMVVVGPEVPLVKGIVDYFASNPLLGKIPVIGPNAKAAMLEGSKEFAKSFMMRHHIPTARYKSVTFPRISEGERFLDTMKPPYVLKADGLAAGKGVLIIDNLYDAKDELHRILTGKFGEAGKTVVIEEFLTGTELSVFIVTDGKSYKILPEAKDYKRIGVGDTGPNTGGMGAVSPVPFADKEFMKRVESRIIIPTIKGLQDEQILFKGFVFFGLINCHGEPYVIEYNARLGDPETEVILPRLQTDLVELLAGVAKGTLESVKVSIDKRFAATVVLAAGGYPATYEKGKIIHGLNQPTDSLIFHAGTTASNNQVVTHGGRVLNVTSLGDTLQEALDKTYHSIEQIHFENHYFRTDIGADLK
jgi:phosphoribosylamine--glycine ligase